MLAALVTVAVLAVNAAMSTRSPGPSRTLAQLAYLDRVRPQVQRSIEQAGEVGDVRARAAALGRDGITRRMERLALEAGQVLGAVVDVSRSLMELGVDELAISDTLGVAGPSDVRRVLGALASAGIVADAIGLHFHDTRGTALANAVTAMELGYRSFDASAGGTGGSPFAPGSAGNLATEDLVYLLDREGVRHGVDLDAVIAAARFMAERVGHPVHSNLGRAGGWPGSVL